MLIFSLCSCKSTATHSYKPSPYVTDTDAVTARVVKKINEETGLKLMGTGGGMIGQINRMGMSFAHYGDLSVEKGRELLVYCIEEYLAAINAEEKIRPHLRHYPFTPLDLEMRIFIYQKDGQEPPTDSLSIVSGIYGRVSYKVSQPFPKITKKIHQEPYEEAKELVFQTDPEMKRIKTSTAHS